MNNWTCPKCSSSNAEGQKFCGSCGTKREEAQQAEPELQPTMLSGYAPQIPLSANPPQQAPANQPPSQNQNRQQNNQPPQNQHQPSNYQAQQNSFPPHQQQQQPPPSFQTPNFSPQFSASPTPAPKKSNLKLFLGLGGAVGLIFLLIIGIILWITLISPYLEEQAFIKKEKENQTRANATSPDSLLPSSLTGYNRTQTFNRMQILQASQQYLPAELKQGSENVTDAAAAEYVNSANSNLKVVSQIFKFNSPENAVAKCQQIVQEMEKRKDASTKIDYYVRPTSKYPSHCAATATGKNNQAISVHSLYGFLIVATGGNATDVLKASNASSSQINR